MEYRVVLPQKVSENRSSYYDTNVIQLSALKDSSHFYKARTALCVLRNAQHEQVNDHHQGRDGSNINITKVTGHGFLLTSNKVVRQNKEIKAGWSVS